MLVFRLTPHKGGPKNAPGTSKSDFHWPDTAECHSSWTLLLFGNGTDSAQRTSPSPSNHHSHFIASSHHLQALRAWEPALSLAFSPGDGKLCHTHGEGRYKGCGNTTMTPRCCFQKCGHSLWTAAFQHGIPKVQF